jgi:hypothetical protein
MTNTSRRQRKVSASDLTFRGYMKAPHSAKPTALGLWVHTDADGRRELLPELIAADIYPGEDATERVIQDVLDLDECGFLTIYEAAGSEWVALERPLRADTRTAPVSACPPPPDRDLSRHVAAVGGARERAEQRVRDEGAARGSAWAEWAAEQERAPQAPARPLLLDAPPIGCPDHPNGRFADCGPCGTARRRHDRWVAQQRHTERLAQFESQQPDDEEPF